MYDAREKANPDHHWELNASRNQGLAEGLAEGKREGAIEGEIRSKIKGKIETIQMLQDILQLQASVDSNFAGKSREELQELIAQLQDEIRNRRSSQD